MTKCLYLHLAKNKDRHMTSVACKSAPLANGWCTEHQYCHDIMLRVDVIGYPRAEINEVFTVCAGRACWLRYARMLLAPGVVFKAIAKGPGVDHYAQAITAIEAAENAYNDAAWSRGELASAEAAKSANERPETRLTTSDQETTVNYTWQPMNA